MGVAAEHADDLVARDRGNLRPLPPDGGAQSNRANLNRLVRMFL